MGVRPPAHVCAALESLPRPERAGVRWVPPQQWHVTLRFLGRADPEEAAAALAGVVLPAAVAVVGPRVTRLGRKVVVLPVAGLDELARAVRAATTDLGEPPDPRGFDGHLTLARVKDGSPRGLTGMELGARFEVSEVELVASVTDPAGAVHEVLGRFPCGRGRLRPGNAGPNTRS